MSTPVAPAPFQSGFRLLDGQGVDNAIAYPLLSFEDAIAAHSGGTKASAYKLSAYFNNVSVVAAVADSVLLPPSSGGMSITVFNNGANAMQVYGAGTDTINGVATATGISQPPGAEFTYFCTAQGAWNQSDIAVGNVQMGVNAAVTAAGTTQGTATATTGNIVNVSVGTANQGILLPVVSNNVAVINGTGNTIKVYPATAAGTIDGGSAGAAVTLTSAHRGATFYNIGSDVWTSSLFGAVSS